MRAELASRTERLLQWHRWRVRNRPTRDVARLAAKPGQRGVPTIQADAFVLRTPLGYNLKDVLGSAAAAVLNSN